MEWSRLGIRNSIGFRYIQRILHAIDRLSDWFTCKCCGIPALPNLQNLIADWQENMLKIRLTNHLLRATIAETREAVCALKCKFESDLEAGVRDENSYEPGTYQALVQRTGAIASDAARLS